VPISFTGPRCARRGCQRPQWKDGLCARCWRFARLFGKPPGMLAYHPLDGYQGGRDAVELPWEEWERQAAAEGIPVADLLAQRRPDPPRA
jgi:hypothetical protein